MKTLGKIIKGKNERGNKKYREESHICNFQLKIFFEDNIDAINNKNVPTFSYLLFTELRKV